jgi:hypothetical protein
MIVPNVAPLEPRRTMIWTWIYIRSESFHVNIGSSSSVVLKKKILYFCDYLPFEKDLALNLIN